MINMKMIFIILLGIASTASSQIPKETFPREWSPKELKDVFYKQIMHNCSGPVIGHSNVDVQVT